MTLIASLLLSIPTVLSQGAPADPVTLDDARARTHAALEQGDAADAHLWLQHWRRLDPGADLDALLARSYLGLGAGAAALEHADRVLAGEPDAELATEMRLVRASALEQCGRSLGAWSAYRAVAAGPELDDETRDSLRALGRASLARHLERETWGELMAWLRSLEQEGTAMSPESAVVLLSFWQWMDPANVQDGTLALVQRHPDHPELAAVYLDYVTRVPYRDITDEDRAVLDTPGFAALPELVQERYRRRIDTHAEDAASAGAMWVDDYGTDNDPLEGPYLEEAALAAQAAKQAWDEQYGEALDEVLAARAELDARFDAIDAEFSAFAALDPPPTLAAMERLGAELTRLREVEREQPAPLDGGLDALSEHVANAQNMLWPPEDGTEDLRSMLTKVARFDEEVLDPLRRARRGEGRTAWLLDRWVNVRLGERPRLTAEAALASGDYATVVEATAEVLLRQEADPHLWRMRRDACVALEAPRLALHAAFVLAGRDEAEEPALVALLDRYLATAAESALAAGTAYEAGDLEGTLPALERALRFDPMQPAALALQARIAADAQDDAALCDLVRYQWSQGLSVGLDARVIADAARRIGDEALAASAEGGAVTFPATPVRPTDAWSLPANATLGKKELAQLAPGQALEVLDVVQLASAPPGDVLRLRGPGADTVEPAELMVGPGALKDRKLRLLESNRVSISSMSDAFGTDESSVLNLHGCGLSARVHVGDQAYLERARAKGQFACLSFADDAVLHLTSSVSIGAGKGPREFVAYDSHLGVTGAMRLPAGSDWRLVDSVVTLLHGSRFAGGSLTLEAGSTLALESVELAGVRPGSVVFEAEDARVVGSNVLAFGAEEFTSGPGSVEVADLVVRRVTMPGAGPDVVVDTFAGLASALRSATPGTVVGVKMGQYDSTEALVVPDGVSLVAVGGPANVYVMITERHAVFEVPGASALHGIRVWLKLPTNENGYLVTSFGDPPTTAVHVEKDGALLAQNCRLDMTSMLENQYFVSVREGARAFLCEGAVGGTIFSRPDSSVVVAEDFSQAIRKDFGVRGGGRVRLTVPAPKRPIDAFFEDPDTQYLGPCLGFRFLYGAGDAPTKARFRARMEQRPEVWAAALEQFHREFDLADSLASRKAAVTRFCGDVRRADPTFGDKRFEADKYLLTHLGPKLDLHLAETGPLIRQGNFDTRVYPGKFVSKRVEAEYGSYISAAVAVIGDGSSNFEDEAFQEALRFFRTVEFGTDEYWLAEEARVAGGGFTEMKAAIVAERERVAEEARQRAAALARAEEQRRLKEEQRAATARLFEQANRERERIRRENAALITGNSSGWYSGYGSSGSSASRPSPSWDSQYLSSDARMRDYRAELDRKIFGTRR